MSKYSRVDFSVAKQAKKWDELDSLVGINEELIKYMRNTDLAKISLDDFYKTQIDVSDGVVGTIKRMKQYNDIVSTGDQGKIDFFIKALSEVDEKLGTTVKGLNRTKMGLGDCAKQLVGATAKTALYTAANVALNAALTFGVSAAISLVVSGLSGLIDNMIVTKEEAEEITNAFLESSNKIKSNISTVEDLEDEYTTLSKGVDALGNNVSLTNEEYSRYKDIVKQLAELNPSIIKGYDSQGNAIINKNNAIRETIELLKEQQSLETQDYTNDKNLKDIFKPIKKEVAEIKDEIENAYHNAIIPQSNDIQYELDKLIERFAELDDEKVYESFSKLYDSFNDNFMRKFYQYDATNEEKFNKIIDNIDEYRSSLSTLKSFADRYNVDFGISLDTSVFTKAAKDIDILEGKLDRLKSSYNSALQLFASTLEGYGDLSPAEQSIVSNYISNLNFDKMVESQGLEEAITKAKNKITSFVYDIVKNSPELTIPLNLALSADTSTQSYEEYKKQVNDALQTLVDSDWAKNNGYDSLDKIKVALGFAFETDDGEIQDQADEVFDKVAHQVYAAFGTKTGGETIPEMGKMLRELTIDELTTLSESDLSKFDSLGEAIAKVINGAISGKFDVSTWFSQNKIDDLQSSIGKLQSAYKTISDGGTLDSDFFKAYPELMEFMNDPKRMKAALQNIAYEKIKPLINGLSELYAQAPRGSSEAAIIKNTIGYLEDMANIDDEIKGDYKAEQQLLKDQIASYNVLIRQAKSRKQLLQSELDDLKSQKDELDKILNGYDNAVSAITSYIDDQIDTLEKQKAAIEESYNAQIKALEDEAKEQERLNNLKEKELALEKAKNTKVRVYDKERGGFRIEADQSAVAAAQKDYDDALRDERIAELERERDAAIKPYEDEISALNDYKEAWEDALKVAKGVQDEINAAMVFGSNWREMVLRKDTSAISGFVQNYRDTSWKLHGIVEPQIEQKEEEIATIDKEIDRLEALKSERQSYLEFIKNYAKQFAGALDDQRKAVEDFVNALNNLKPDGVISEAIWNAINDSFNPEYATSGNMNSKALATIHNALDKFSVLLSNSQTSKLWELLTTGQTAQMSKFMNSAPSVFSGVSNYPNAFNGIPNYMSKNSMDKLGRKNLGNVDNSTTFVITGNDIRAKDYDEFKGYMDRYIREANMNRLVGKR